MNPDENNALDEIFLRPDGADTLAGADADDGYAADADSDGIGFDDLGFDETDWI